jgi:signal transduction histidine kinase
MNTAFVISAALLGTLSFLLGVFVYAKNRASNVNRTWMILNFAASLWSWSLFARELSTDESTALFFVRLCYVGAIFIPALFLRFTVSLLKVTKKELLFSIYILSFIFIILDFTPLFIKDVKPILSFHFYGIPGPIFPFFVISFIGITGYSHYILVQHLKRSEGQVRAQVKYLLLATVIGFLGGVSTFLPNFNIEVFPFGFYLISIYVGIISYAIAKHRLMDISIVLKKGTTYALLIMVLFVPSSLLILLFQKLVYGDIHYIFSGLVFFLLLLVTTLFNRIKPHTEKAVEQFLFRNRYDYRETLGNFSKAMVTILDLKSLSKKIIETVTQTMGVEKASLFFLNEERGGYYLLESKNIKIASFPPVLSKGDPLPQYLQKIKEIVIREELVKGVTIPEISDVVNTLTRLEAEVTLPLISKGQLIGMINLSHKFNKDIYSHEDIELLSTLANQTTVAIENARLYDDLKKSKSYIRRADRLASLGTLTAGIAHEIRNPLVAIKTFTQLLPERIDDEEFRNHFLNIASGEVDRISALVTELLEFARPSEPKFELEDINGILDGMILLVSTETKSKRIDILKDYGSDLSPITIDREQMKQVFLNMLLNAIEATPENGKIYVKTRSYTKPDGEPYIQIEFTDTGCGIRPEYLEDIFTPFFTTKEKGSGLGLSISNQIIQDHKGYIDVESQVNRGTSFFINLPLHQYHPKRRQSDFESQPPLIHPIERP